MKELGSERKQERAAVGGVDVLALDLEGTLINSIFNPVPRPHVHEFLRFCFDNVPNVALYTGVDDENARRQLVRLCQDGFAPGEARGMPIVPWARTDGESWQKKDLLRVRGMYPGSRLHRIYLVDDLEVFVEPTQWDQWIPIVSYQGVGVRADDVELLRVRGIVWDLLRGKVGVQRRGFPS